VRRVRDPASDAEELVRWLRALSPPPPAGLAGFARQLVVQAARVDRADIRTALQALLAPPP